MIPLCFCCSSRASSSSGFQTHSGAPFLRQSLTSCPDANGRRLMVQYFSTDLSITILLQLVQTAQLLPSIFGIHSYGCALCLCFFRVRLASTGSVHPPIRSRPTLNSLY